MLFPDLSLTLSQRRRPCVLDPGLMLSRFGLPLVRRLGELVELWMVRELWHVLDNSQFFLEQPHSLFRISNEDGPVAGRETPSRDEVAIVLNGWERIRMANDLSGLKIFWIGDGLSESLVPAGAAADLVWRYESLARRLDRHLAGSGPMACAARDTAALVAALGAAFVLTYRTSREVEAGMPPAICDVFTGRFPCQPVAEDDPIMAIERAYLRHLLVHSGAAGLLWSGLHLAVLHLAAPAAAAVDGAPPLALTDDLVEIETAPPAADAAADPWDGARAFWYQL
jgi:hypothetical protein